MNPERAISNQVGKPALQLKRLMIYEEGFLTGYRSS